MSEAPLSPCVRRCEIGGDGLCLGCGRTLAEIAAWSALSNPERRAIMARLASRRTRLSPKAPPPEN